MRIFFDDAKSAIVYKRMFLLAFSEAGRSDAIVDFAWRAKVKN